MVDRSEMEIIMNINAVGGYTGVNYGTIASGKRINSAADDAAGLAQVQKLNSQSRGLDQGAANAKDMDNLTKVADGALGSINDYLQAIRDKSLQASNGLLTKSDKQAIQNEISQYLQGINDVANNTTFNTRKILNEDGDMFTMTGPDGSGKDVKTGNATLKSLGLEDYDVTGDFDISRIDKAIDQINSMRGSEGAASNALMRIYSYNQNTSENTVASSSRLEDLDMGAAISEQKKNQVLDEYKNVMLKKQMEQESLVTKMLQ